MRSHSLRWAMTNKKMAGVRPPPHRLDPHVYLQVSSDPSQDEPANVGERDTDRKTRYLRNLACPGAHGLCSIRPHMKLRAHGFRNRAITPPAVTFDTWYCHSQRVGLVYLHPHGEDAGASHCLFLQARRRRPPNSACRSSLPTRLRRGSFRRCGPCSPRDPVAAQFVAAFRVALRLTDDHLRIARMWIRARLTSGLRRS
jgi:hypothetical protein